jgi:cytochrome c-type biogenesis protein CcmH
MRAAALALLLALTAPALAVDSPREMLPDPQQEARAETIGQELRCLVCQNESIEDSSADLARDLRKIVRERVASGESDQQVIGWMVERYGNFVRLRPPFDAATLLLWGSPVLALAAGAVAVLASRRRSVAAPQPLTEEERQRLAQL